MGTLRCAIGGHSPDQGWNSGALQGKHGVLAPENSPACPHLRRRWSFPLLLLLRVPFSATVWGVSQASLNVPDSFVTRAFPGAHSPPPHPHLDNLNPTLALRASFHPLFVPTSSRGCQQKFPPILLRVWRQVLFREKVFFRLFGIVFLELSRGFLSQAPCWVFPPIFLFTGFDGGEHHPQAEGRSGLAQPHPLCAVWGPSPQGPDLRSPGPRGPGRAVSALGALFRGAHSSTTWGHLSLTCVLLSGLGEFTRSHECSVPCACGDTFLSPSCSGPPYQSPQPPAVVTCSQGLLPPGDLARERLTGGCGSVLGERQNHSQVRNGPTIPDGAESESLGRSPGPVCAQALRSAHRALQLSPDANGNTGQDTVSGQDSRLLDPISP